MMRRAFAEHLDDLLPEVVGQGVTSAQGDGAPAAGFSGLSPPLSASGASPVVPRRVRAGGSATAVAFASAPAPAAARGGRLSRSWLGGNRIRARAALVGDDGSLTASTAARDVGAPHPVTPGASRAAFAAFLGDAGVTSGLRARNSCPLVPGGRDAATAAAADGLFAGSRGGGRGAFHLQLRRGVPTAFEGWIDWAKKNPMQAMALGSFVMGVIGAIARACMVLAAGAMLGSMMGGFSLPGMGGGDAGAKDDEEEDDEEEDECAQQ
eukprot:TRINITY_DN30373_c0_g1_i1.p1 TRINITY_DN30373_c0_g1~~TRINITY_DN30373_c0_g1_i1.p1  ORF type:complete len:266 (-),score=57.88 TRINITY_DN30373_c0_g1_i1:81-878(-)